MDIKGLPWYYGGMWWRPRETHTEIEIQEERERERLGAKGTDSGLELR